MTTARSRKKRKPAPKKRPKGSRHLLRIFLFLLLGGLLLVSVTAAGYIIFFQTVLAREIPAQTEKTIVFEEPNPPIHSEDVEAGDIVNGQPAMVALILDDIGYDEVQGRRILDFPFTLNYSFLPFAPFTRKLESLANRQGKTVLLHLPLEPRNYNWEPGPGTIYLDDSAEVQKEKFIRCLAEVPHAKGVNNHMGSRFTEDGVAMNRLMRLIGERGLFFVDSFTTAQSVGYQVAQKLRVKSGKRQVFLDNDLDQSRICRQLEKLVKIAEKRGKAIGIGHPHKETVDALESCLPLYSGRVQFVSVEELL